MISRFLIRTTLLRDDSSPISFRRIFIRRFCFSSGRWSLDHCILNGGGYPFASQVSLNVSPSNLIWFFIGYENVIDGSFFVVLIVLLADDVIAGDSDETIENGEEILFPPPGSSRLLDPDGVAKSSSLLLVTWLSPLLIEQNNPTHI